MRQNGLVVINDISQFSQLWPGLKQVLAYGGHSLLSVPLTARGELIGILNLVSAQTNAFGTAEIEISRQIGNSLAIALYNAQLFEEEQRARTEAETMREVATSLSTKLDQDALLQVILAQLAQVLPLDGAAVFLLEDGRLQVAATYGRAPRKLEYASEWLDPPPRNLQVLIETKQPMIIPDTTSYPGWVWVPGRESIRCWLGVPLMQKGSLRGILTLDKKEAHAYDNHSAQLAQAFASQAAIALENARLYEQVQSNAANLRGHVTQRTRQLKSLYDITAIAGRHLDLQILLDEALTRTLQEFDCAAGAVLLLDDSKTRLLLLAHKHLSTTQIDLLAGHRRRSAAAAGNPGQESASSGDRSGPTSCRSGPPFVGRHYLLCRCRIAGEGPCLWSIDTLGRHAAQFWCGGDRTADFHRRSIWRRY